MNGIIPLAVLGSLALLGTAPADTKSPARKSAELRAKSDANQPLEARVEANFETGWTKLEAGDHEASANELSAAAVKMRNLTEGSTLKEADAVNASAAELDELAAGVSGKLISRPTRLDPAFTRAHQRLASYQHARSEALLAAKDHQSAGTTLNRTADHIEHAARWSGEALEDTGKGTVKGIRALAGGLVGGTGAVIEGTGTVMMKGLGLITRLGTKMKGQPAAPGGTPGQNAVDGTRKVSGGTVEGIGKVTEAAAGVVEKAGEGLKKTGEKVSGKE